MDVALVTGADNSIGLSICRKLITLGFRVYGLAHKKETVYFTHKDFLLQSCNLGDVAALESCIKGILDAGHSIHTLVHAAREDKLFNNKSLEEASGQELAHIVQARLVGPLLTTKLALPSIQELKGQIINICWPSREPLKASCQKGLEGFSEALFNWVRDTGVRITTIEAYNNTEVPTPGVSEYGTPQSIINPERIAEAIEGIVRYGSGNVITKIEIRPQATQELEALPKIETGVNPYESIQLPDPNEASKQEELILTPKPKRHPRNNQQRPQRKKKPFIKKSDHQKESSKAEEKESIKEPNKSTPVKKKHPAKKRPKPEDSEDSVKEEQKPREKRPTNNKRRPAKKKAPKPENAEVKAPVEV